ncbi:MAG: AzlC family ABC transporter permease [Campylobacterales bacterium]|nr:AzlC family ABC transporter permease [Campylobacterales bacterium]
MRFGSVVKLTVPVMMGYIPLGMAFGLLASSMLIPWYYAFAMSMLIYAGSGQFLALTLFAAHATLLEIGVATFLLNLRHFFYGLSMIGAFEGMGKGKHYLIYGLTDETFALLKTASMSPQNREKTYLQITALNQFYWVLGTVIGAVLGNVVPFNYTGIEFSLTALFVVLSIELYRKQPSPKPLMVALLIGMAGMVILPSSKMLIFSLALAAALLIGLRGWIDE